MCLGSLFGMALGLWISNWLLVGIAAVGLVYVVQSFIAIYQSSGFSLRRSKRKPKQRSTKPTHQPSQSTSGYLSGSPHHTTDMTEEDDDDPEEPPVRRKPSSDPTDTDSLVEEMFEQGRYALLLRQQIADNLSPDQLRKAVAALEDKMALVPEGVVWLQQPKNDSLEQGMTPGALEGGRLINIEPVFLDRYPVTNREYRVFLDAGGYCEMALWSQEIWPGVIDFVDRSGQPGPRFWSKGKYPRGAAEHPVVGVSWYEASAYAQWLGKRLPNDPEWVKAGCWPVAVDDSLPLQRKYPWGESMDLNNANLWATGLGGTTPVTAYEGGMSVGGIYQLIGNVWEWTDSRYGDWHSSQEKIEVNVAMRSIRGGSFDTYFDNHATCHFQSGESPVARKHNIGFRCCLGICDLAPLRSIVNQGESEEVATVAAEV